MLEIGIKDFKTEMDFGLIQKEKTIMVSGEMEKLKGMVY
jgi:hypothetical protein